MERGTGNGALGGEGTGNRALGGEGTGNGALGGEGHREWSARWGGAQGMER